MSSDSEYENDGDDKLTYLDTQNVDMYSCSDTLSRTGPPGMHSAMTSQGNNEHVFRTQQTLGSDGHNFDYQSP